MSGASESVVYCEGFYDRAFWAGWLQHLGCRDARPRRADGSHDAAIDPWGKTVKGGAFAYLTPSGRFVRVQPCGNTQPVKDAVARRIRRRAVEPLAYLIDNRDDDGAAGASDGPSTRARAIAQHHAQAFAGEVIGDAVIRLSDCTVGVVLWSAPDPSCSDLPDQQTLERLVCSALCEAWPERGPIVSEWLRLARRGEPSGPKAFAWAHMAGYYPDAGCDDFYQGVWRSPEVAGLLERRLNTTGVAGLVRELAT